MLESVLSPLDRRRLRSAALRSAAGEGPGGEWLTKTDLASIRDAALIRLAAAGADLGLLELLSHVRLEARDLPADYLALTSRDQNLIEFDLRGAASGWFVDPTALADEEFGGGVAVSPRAKGAASI